MNPFLFIATMFFILANSVSAQQTSISIIDFVKIKNNHRQEAVYYYENNWLPARKTAMEKGFISAYRIYTCTPDSAGNFDLILITEFKDSAQYALREENFRLIINAANPNGPKLLNALKPGDFRQNLFYKTAGILHENKR